MTKYIQITKATEESFWYAKEDFLEAIFEVKQCPDIPEDWTVVTKHHRRNILKSDCEEVALPQVPDGAHLITTAQLKELYTTIKIAYDPAKALEVLQEWFPAVFKPARTYKVGDRFKWLIKNHLTYRIIYLQSSEIGLLIEESDCLAWGNRLKVADKNKITDDEMQSLTGYKFGSFTLLPDTSALEEHEAHDNALPKALKGGSHV